MIKQRIIWINVLIVGVFFSEELAYAMECPVLGESSSRFDENMVWMCEQINWRNSLADWKKRVEETCLISDVEEFWRSVITCPNFHEVDCLDDSLRHIEIDTFNCTIVSCEGGKYSNRKVFRKIWRQHLDVYKAIMSIYTNDIRHCSPRGCADSANEDEITAAVTMTTAFDSDQTTQPEMTTTTADGNNERRNWTVFQRRMDGSEDFYRNWTEYVNGFGDTDTEFWLGLEAIHQLTKNGDKALRIDMIERNGEYMFAEYSSFMVGPASSNYTLHVSGYSGNATDAFADPPLGVAGEADGQQFSTYDMDNDASDKRVCAVISSGAWWYSGCHYSNLNGLYHGTSSLKVMRWFHQTEYKDMIMKFTEMKIR